MDTNNSLNYLTLLNRLFQNGSITNILDKGSNDLISKKHSVSEEKIINLLGLHSHVYSKLYNAISGKNYLFTEYASNIIKSYFKFISELIQIPNFINKEIKHHSGNETFIYTQRLLEKIISLDSNPTQISNDPNSTPRYPLDIKSPLNSFLVGSGRLALQRKNNNETYNFIEPGAQKLINTAKRTLKPEELSELRYQFLTQYFEDRELESACLNVFSTHECAPLTTTTTPLIITSVDPVNLTTKAGITTTELPVMENRTFHLGYKIGTAMSFGALTGFLNGGSQILLHIAEQKQCSLPTQRFLAVTLALANSLAISTLPLIYSIVENLANEETDSLVNSQKVLTCTYAFITSIALQGINAAGMRYTFPKKLILKNLLNLLPLFAGLWMLANSDESLMEHLIILSANVLTALAVSSMTYFSFNRCISAKNQLKGDTEASKNTARQEVKSGNANTFVTEIQALMPPIRKTFHYLSEKNLNDIREKSLKLKDLLENFISSLKESINNHNKNKNTNPNSQAETLIAAYEAVIENKNTILQKLNPPFMKVQRLHELLMEEKHNEACKEYTDYKIFNSVMEQTGNVFKSMEIYYESTTQSDNLRNVLNEAIGFVQGKEKNFDSDTLENLNAISESLNTLLSPVKLFIGIYNTFNAGRKGEIKGEQVASTKFFSIASDHSRTSTVSDESDESNQSTLSGNSVFNPIDSQQEIPLLLGANPKI
jgi:hypothetical protein